MSHLPAWGWTGYVLEEVISDSISVRVERDSKAKQKHPPLPAPAAPRCYRFPNFHQMGLVGAPQRCSSDPSRMARNQSEQPLMGTRCFILIRSWLRLETDVFLTRIFWGLSCDNKWQ